MPWTFLNELAMRSVPMCAGPAYIQYANFIP
jgi:hypothetical protein